MGYRKEEQGTREGLEPLHKYSWVTSKEWAPSEEPKGEHRDDERSPVVCQAQHEDTGPQYLEVMKGKMGDNGGIIYDYTNKESDGGPDG